MRKVSGKFKPSKVDHYVYRGMSYESLLRGTRVKFYLFEKDTQLYVGVLKRKWHLGVLLSLLAITVSGYLFKTSNILGQAVCVPEQILVRDGIVELNVVNGNSSENNMDVFLYINDGKEIIRVPDIKPGESIGNIVTDTVLGRGSQIGRLVIRVNGTFRTFVCQYDILVTVE